MKRPLSQQKVSPRGASRNRQVNKRHLPEFLQRFLGVFVLACMGVVVIYGVNQHMDFDVVIDRPVASVSVEGDFHFVSREKITELVTPLVNKKFLQLNLNQIKDSIEQEAYVDYAMLSRRWPDQLRVRIVEQTPIARWGDSGFLNQRGEVIPTQDTALINSLPLLEGQIAQSAKVMTHFQRVSQLLRAHDLFVAELRSDEKYSWQLTLTNGLLIVIGRDQVMDKLQRFLMVYENRLKSVTDEIALVDVRYNNGVAVRWTEQPETTEKIASAR